MIRLRDIGVIGTGVWESDVVTNDRFKVEEREKVAVKDPFLGRRRDDGTLDVAGMSFTPARHPRTIAALHRAFTDPHRGARRRRLFKPDEKVSDAEADAARRALDDAGIRAADVDVVLVQSFLPDELQPHNAALVAHKLGITRAPAWSLDSICNSVMAQWSVGGSLIAAGGAKHVLCVQSVAYSRVTDYGASTSVQDSDLATAFVLGRSPGSEAVFSWETNGSLHSAIHLGWAPPSNAPRRSFHQPSSERLLIRFDLELQPKVLGELASRAEKLCAETLAAAEMRVEDIEVFLSHQPMSWYSALMSDTLGLRDGVAFDTFEEYGNVNSTSLGASMHHARKEGRLQRGTRTLLFNPAAGYTYAGAAIRW